MKRAIYLVFLACTAISHAQPPLLPPSPPKEETSQKYIFPEGFNPDGKIGNLNFSVFAGFVSQSQNGDQRADVSNRSRL